MLPEKVEFSTIDLINEDTHPAESNSGYTAEVQDPDELRRNRRPE